MKPIKSFLQKHSKRITVLALALAIMGTILLSLDYFQWSNILQKHSKRITVLALVLAIMGTILLSLDYFQWSNIKRAKFTSDYGVVTAIIEDIGMQKWGSLCVSLALIIQLVVEVNKP